MSHYLVVANQTLGGAVLDRAVNQRIRRGNASFHILVPMTELKHETSAWARGFDVEDEEETSPARVGQTPETRPEEGAQDEAAVREAQRRAQRRLDLMISRMRATGAQVDGELGVADPVEATRDALRREPVDEVILSTLPSGLSRWTKLDLPSRVAEMTDVPVTTVEAET